jgi:hypothetical protein
LSERIEAELDKIRRFVEEISKDWGVSPPKVEFLGYVPILGYTPVAYYVYETKTMYLHPRFVDLFAVLHEFFHHIQNEYRWHDLQTIAEERRKKPHCERIHEIEAKVFESYAEFYRKLWREIVGE